MRFKFVQLRTTDFGGFTFPNEHPVSHRDCVDGLKYDRVGAICSGGEVPLTIYGPHCKEMVLVDHGLSALVCAAVKLLALDNLPLAEFKAMMHSGSPTRDRLNNVADHLEGTLHEHHKHKNAFQVSTYYDYQTWWGIEDALLERLKANIPNITLVHGDLRDLKRFGKFDLIYGSNAINDHFGWDNSKPQLDDFTEATRFGSHIVYTTHPESKAKNFTQIKADTYGGWVYRLVQRTTSIPIGVKQHATEPFPTSPYRSYR